MNICVFGDSIAWGANDLERGGWVERLKMYYLEQSDDIEVCNLGISGNVTEQVLDRMDVECKARDPQIILFAIGINDTQFFRSEQKIRVSESDFRRNIECLIEKAKQYTSKIIFVGLTRVDEPKVQPLPWNHDKEYRNDFIGRYDDALKEIVKSLRCEYIGVKDVIQKEDLDDGLHPNGKGHEKMFCVVRNYLSKVA